MIYIQDEIPDKVGYIIPIGDIHVGDRSFTRENQRLLQGYIDWVKARKNARVILMGDVFNVATRQSKTSPYEQTDDELKKAIDLFRPIADKIVCAIDGNHEQRLIDFANFSIMNAFCQTLKIKYAQNSAVVVFKVGRFKRAEAKRGNWRQHYIFYAHHTTGGGATVGGKLNRVDKLRQMVVNADVYLGGHNHMLGLALPQVLVVDPSHKKVVKKRQLLVDCGSYLEWNHSYAEAKQQPPMKLGSPKIRLDGSHKHDVHVSF